MQRLIREHNLDIVEFPNWEGLALILQRTSHVPMVVRLHTSSKESHSINGTPATRTNRWDVKREMWQGAVPTS